MKRILPASIFEVIQVPIFGWEFQDKHVLHDKVGSAFILVTTGQSQLWCADPDMAHAILARRKDFVQSPLSSKVMGFLGENIVTVSPSHHQQGHGSLKSGCASIYTYIRA